MISFHLIIRLTNIICSRYGHRISVLRLNFSATTCSMCGFCFPSTKRERPIQRLLNMSFAICLKSNQRSVQTMLLLVCNLNANVDERRKLSNFHEKRKVNKYHRCDCVRFCDIYQNTMRSPNSRNCIYFLCIHLNKRSPPLWIYTVISKFMCRKYFCYNNAHLFDSIESMIDCIIVDYCVCSVRHAIWISTNYIYRQNELYICLYIKLAIDE